MAYTGDTTFSIPEHPPQPPEERDSAIFGTADPGYFQAMQIPLVAGRFFASGERLGNSSFAIINEKLATRILPQRGSALGKHLAVSWRSPAAENLRDRRRRRRYALSRSTSQSAA
jgi:hypothetical protein